MNSGSKKNQAKAEDERAIFQLFLEKQGWPTEVSLFESREAPEPDILYEFVDGKIAFELLELCVSEVAEEQSKLTDGLKEPEVLRISDPTSRLVRKKLRKNYVSQFPIDLLCYSNGRIGTPDDLVVRRMTDVIVCSKAVKFRCVWYYGKKGIYKIYEASIVSE